MTDANRLENLANKLRLAKYRCEEAGAAVTAAEVLLNKTLKSLELARGDFSLAQHELLAAASGEG